MKILVTGGAGFSGSHLVGQFQGRAEVRALDNLASSFQHNLAGLRGEFIHGSVLDREQVAHMVKDVDGIFHLAAMVSLPESAQKPQACIETNAW